MQEQSRKVTLPGQMYQRAGQWWWMVKLPGEDQARARLLEAPGTRAAACDPEIAERVAIQMWEQAVVREGARHVILDCLQKVERFKALFLDKLRHFTAFVESATANARTEARARAEMESKLNGILPAAGLSPKDLGRGTEAFPSDVRDSPANPQTAAWLTGVAENPAPSEAGFCECCGRTSIPTADLEQIDSGQRLCASCLHTLRIDALQAELDALTESLA
jgi:hypothetical protein